MCRENGAHLRGMESVDGVVCRTITVHWRLCHAALVAIAPFGTLCCSRLQAAAEEGELCLWMKSKMPMNTTERTSQAAVQPILARVLGSRVRSVDRCRRFWQKIAEGSLGPKTRKWAFKPFHKCRLVDLPLGAVSDAGARVSSRRMRPNGNGSCRG